MMHTHTHAHMHARMHAYTHTHAHTHTHTRTHTHTCTHTHTHTHTHMHNTHTCTHTHPTCTDEDVPSFSVMIHFYYHCLNKHLCAYQNMHVLVYVRVHIHSTCSVPVCLRSHARNTVQSLAKHQALDSNLCTQGACLTVCRATFMVL